MFNKVLIAEDIDTISLAVQLTLIQLGITNMQHVKYCDDAILKIKKAIQDNEPFDLLITDLSFEPDSRSVKLTSGQETIAEIHKIQPSLKTIVYSVEDKKSTIKTLYDDYKINAYVHKSRNSIEQLKTAITQVYSSNSAFISTEIKYLIADKEANKIDYADVQILKQLALGNTQDQIADFFKTQNINPSSKSAIEKKVNKLKDSFKANNTAHLVAITKDLGII
ncbi:response regulator [Flavobacterium capsici]|uniref:Response regulator n=1 Tax=Flavobacterium capsici TaxID=3075618 RepID=A0AA96EY13_9FLAO|nr:MULTISPECIES: response regulator [unclassified Flavobacterium]WNM19135.1 response regulator [Flavobacterium sp. PMR2A8]WNM20524.1 response regulator [Flavobacterium sp. PMTSA4]